MPEFLLKVEGTIHTLSTPWVMGILNITPDSFFEGSRFSSAEKAAQRAEEMIADGAKIIDIGGYSSRPGADAVSPEEEWQRLESVIPAVRAVVDKHPGTFISVDTFRASVAEKAVGAGAHMVNDISGGNLDERMYEVVAKLQVPLHHHAHAGRSKHHANQPHLRARHTRHCQILQRKITPAPRHGHPRHHCRCRLWIWQNV
jgi:dihydropteroate synthase